MIHKIIIFSENNGTGFNYMKSASNLRLSYMLRSIGYEVKQVHNCLSFTSEEIKQIIEEFTQGQQCIACFSSSFINTTFRKNVLEPENQDKVGNAWGLDAYSFLVNAFLLCKNMGIVTLFGGWEIIEDKFRSTRQRFSWGIDSFDKIVDYYVIGNNIDVIDDLAKGRSIEYQEVNGSKIARTKEVTNFTDCASTPLPNDFVLQDESLSTEIAAGCIFSCQFCNYAALGKKKTEYMRTYESLERELITNYENFQTRMYLLTDNIMNDYDEKLKYLIKIREKTGIDIRWSGYVRLDTIKRKEQAQLLLDSGIAGATFGIESLKKEAGPSIGKMTDKDKLMKSFEIFRDVIGDNCVTTASFISGLPNESRDDLYKTYQWLNSPEGKHCIDHYSFTSLLLFRGNETKNDINIGRNDPFSVYERGNGPERWTSPWGTSDEFSKLAFEFNRSTLEQTAAFTLPFLHNVGLKVENAVKLARSPRSSENDFTRKQIFTRLRNNYQNRIQIYKSKMLDK